MAEPPKNPRVRRLLDSFKEWADQKWGRQAEAARAIGVAPQLLSDWLAQKKHPTGEQALALQEFVKAQKRPKP
jgi:hypothetical protein